MELTVITYDNNKKLNFKVSDDPVRPELDLDFNHGCASAISAV